MTFHVHTTNEWRDHAHVHYAINKLTLERTNMSLRKMHDDEKCNFELTTDPVAV